MTTTLNNNPIVNDVTGLRANITSVATPTAPNHDYLRPPLIQLPAPVARTLDQFVKPISAGPDELLKHRFLCRGGGLLLVGQTGLGKSSLAMQLMIKWALGQTAFGLEPARPIKSLLIQAENDDDDLGEMKHGVFSGLNLSEADHDLACQNIYVTQESRRTGGELFQDVVSPLLTKIKPDLLWLDPALSYLGGDMNSQKDVGKFLRNDLGPVLIKHYCGAVIIHHTNKISNNPDRSAPDPTYLGAGSAEWSNWSRAVMVLRKTDVADLYELKATKRGGRLKWRAADGEAVSFTKYIGHTKQPDTICWLEMNITEAEEMQANGNKTVADLLKHVPGNSFIAKNDLIDVGRRNGIGKDRAYELIGQMLNKQLFEYRIRREGVCPKVYLSRKPETEEQTKLKDSTGCYTKLPEINIESAPQPVLD